MTWTVEHTIPYVDDGTEEAQQTAALKYFFDTFLPARGWTVGFRDGEDETSSYRIFQRNFTDIFTGLADKHYMWVNIGSKYMYEDATYNTTPGDKGTDTTNSVYFNWHSGTSEYLAHSYKFWVSSENPKAFIVTRWNTIMAWDMGNDWPTYKPNASKSVGPSIDRWETCVWLAMHTGTQSPTFRWSNLPAYSNTSNTEAQMNMGPDEQLDCLGSQNGFFDTFEFWYDAEGARAVVKAADVRWFNYAASNSGISSVTPSMSSFIVVQVNGEDYWLFTKGSKLKSQICLNIGNTVPDFE